MTPRLIRVGGLARRRVESPPSRRLGRLAEDVGLAELLEAPIVQLELAVLVADFRSTEPQTAVVAVALRACGGHASSSTS